MLTEEKRNNWPLCSKLTHCRERSKLRCSCLWICRLLKQVVVQMSGSVSVLSLYKTQVLLKEPPMSALACEECVTCLIALKAINLSLSWWSLSKWKPVATSVIWKRLKDNLLHTLYKSARYFQSPYRFHVAGYTQSGQNGPAYSTLSSWHILPLLLPAKRGHTGISEFPLWVDTASSNSLWTNSNCI